MSGIKEIFGKISPSRSAFFFICSVFIVFGAQCGGTYLAFGGLLRKNMGANAYGLVSNGILMTALGTALPFLFTVPQFGWKRGLKGGIELLFVAFGIFLTSYVLFSIFSYFSLPVIALFIFGIFRIFIREYAREIEKKRSRPNG